MNKTEKEPKSDTPTRTKRAAVVLSVLGKSRLAMMGDLERGEDDGDGRGEYLSCRTPDTSSKGVVLFDRRLRYECVSGVDDADDDVDEDDVVATDIGEPTGDIIGSL